MAGFRSLVAVDVEPNLQSAFKRNFPQTLAIQASVSEIGKSEWKHFIGDVRPDAVIGGPPCQGFSFIGKRQVDDPRNGMISQFFRHVELLRPKFFLMENVEGLLHGENANILSAALERVSGLYTILPPMIVSASDFGAATKRKRVVVIGFDPNEVDPITASDLTPGGLTNTATVRDAISDLPSPVPEVKGDYGWVRYPRRSKTRLPVYASALREGPPPGLGWTPAVEKHKAGFISGVAATRHSRAIAHRYASTPCGKTDQTTKSYRLEWDGQCPTLRAGTGAEKGAFQAVRPLHPGKGRVITVREAARLQGFPDWFVFHHTKWHSFRMIGNSVPPPVSYGLLSRIFPKLHLPLAT